MFNDVVAQLDVKLFSVCSRSPQLAAATDVNKAILNKYLNSLSRSKPNTIAM